MLEALTNSSPLEKLTLWGSALRFGLECPETSLGPGGGQAGKGERQARPGQRQSEPGHRGMEEKCPLGTGPGRPPQIRLPSRQHSCALPGPLPVASPFPSLWRGLLTRPKGRVSSGYSPPLPFSASASSQEEHFPVLVAAWLHLATLQRSCVWGERDERGGGNSTAKKKGGKHTRLEKGTRTTSDFHPAEATAEPVRQ